MPWRVDMQRTNSRRTHMRAIAHQSKLHCRELGPKSRLWSGQPGGSSSPGICRRSPAKQRHLERESCRTASVVLGLTATSCCYLYSHSTAQHPCQPSRHTGLTGQLMLSMGFVKCMHRAARAAWQVSHARRRPSRHVVHTRLSCARAVTSRPSTISAACAMASHAPGGRRGSPRPLASSKVGTCVTPRASSRAGEHGPRGHGGGALLIATAALCAASSPTPAACHNRSAAATLLWNGACGTTLGRGYLAHEPEPLS